MIKNYLLLLALCLFSSLNAQIINFPDTNFKAKLLEADVVNAIAKDKNQKNIKIDLNGDGEIDQSEASNVYYLTVSESDISSLIGIKSFNNLLDLNCYINNISDLDISDMPNLLFANCNINKIENINYNGSLNLRGLNCSSNLLKHLDLSNLTELIELNCQDNQLTSLDVKPLKNLSILLCDFNSLTSLDLSGQDSKQFLDLGFSQNNISNLDIARFTNLRSLSCGDNPMTSLDITAFSSLESLAYYNTKITNYDVTKFPNLLVLICYGTETTRLDLSGLKKLRRLDFGENDIEKIDLKEAVDLVYLRCSNNKLTSLDLSKLTKLEALDIDFCNISVLNFDDLVSLERAGISNTLIKSMDFGHSPFLKRIAIAQNPFLETINLKNGNLEYEVTITQNPKLIHICADDDQITNIENILKEDGVTDYNVNSYCTFAPGGESFSIQGTNRNDLNSNGCDALDIPASFLKFKIDNGVKSGNFISNETGKYHVKVPAGNYKVIPVFENPSYFTISPTEIQADFPTDSSPQVQDFCIEAVGVHYDLEVTILPLWPSRPGFIAKYKIIYKNKGNVAQSGTVNLGFDNSVIDLINSNPSVSITTSNKISWNFTNLKPFESREIVLNLKINSPIETPAINNGDILSYIASIISPETDELPIDNTFVYNETVVGSYDPNDKTCLEGKVIKPELIGEYVHYLIRFENTGTYKAENVVIKDIIDTSKFDVSTLVPTSASHSYTTKISDGNKVEFIFEKIDLPFDDANNDGYIAFKIKTLPTLNVGDSFENEANIYFDYNFPVLTNKETSTFKTLGRQDFELSSSFTIHPNPVRNYLQIDSKDSIEIQSIYVYNVLGQLIQVIPNAHNISKIDVSKFQSGQYILQIKTINGKSTTKFIKI